MDINHLTPNTQAILLLCGKFTDDPADLPLTGSEYSQLARWLMGEGMAPADLLTPEGMRYLERYEHKKVTPLRLLSLLRRGGAMALALEHWTNKGLWLLSRSDALYPQRLKDVLRHLAPPILYGAGDMQLLNQGGLGVVGSREVDEDGLRFSREVAALCAREGVNIISGGAKGVDSEAMLGGLDNGAKVAGILSHGLSQATRSRVYRQWLESRDLVLVSQHHPDAGFSVGAAMGRNKYIYALSDACLVVASDVKGGTWSGATENLKQRWVPLLVRQTANMPAGNAPLIESGGIAVDLDTFTAATPMGEWLRSLPLPADPEPAVKQDSMFAMLNVGIDPYSPAQAEPESILFESRTVYQAAATIDSFNLVWPAMSRMLGHPCSVNTLAHQLCLLPAQIQLWLDRALAQDMVILDGETGLYILKNAES